MQPPALHELIRYFAGCKGQFFESIEEFTIKVKNIVDKMPGNTPEILLGNNILLAAMVTKTTLDLGTTIKAILFFPFRLVRQIKNFLKNKDKSQSSYFTLCVTKTNGYFWRYAISGEPTLLR
jgi:hypothetical protein